MRGRFLLGAFLPGLPQLVQGRVAAGATVLLGWLASVTVFLTRTEAVAAGLDAGFAMKMSSWSVIGVAGGLWFWSLHDLSRGIDPEEPQTTAGDPAGLGATARRLPAAVHVGGLLLGAWALAALWAPFLAPHGPEVQLGLLDARLLPPGSTALLGTDDVSRDVLSRLLWAGRTSLGVAVWVVGISTVVGVALGTLAGLGGRWLDGALMRVADVFMAVPRLVLLIAVLAALGASVPALVVVLGLTLWPPTARMVRGELLSLRNREFVLAARGSGVPRHRIVVVHLLPHALPPVLVTAALAVGQVILLEAGLSFLGLGPALSWGGMVADGRDHLAGAWWLASIPGLAIVSVTVGANLVGEGVRTMLEGR